MAGFFVVVEGLDSSGKNTQAELLARRLSERGYKSEIVHFPRYDTEYGKLVKRYLSGEFGAKEEVPPEIPSMLYAMDRYDFRAELLRKLESGDVIIADRYVQSNFGFQGAKFRGEERAKFIEWMKTVESRMPQPSLVLFFDVPVEVTAKLMEQRWWRKKDIHEIDAGYQNEVRSVYLDVAAKDGWVVIDCMERGRGTVKSVEAVSDEAYAAVEQRLKSAGSE